MPNIIKYFGYESTTSVLKNISGQFEKKKIILLHLAGKVYTWGRNVDGQLGNGSRKEVHTPTSISINLVMQSMENEVLSCSIKHITCGGDFSLAMDESGKIWAWGTNVQGQVSYHILCVGRSSEVRRTGQTKYEQPWAEIFSSVKLY